VSFKALDWAIDQGNDLTSAEKFVLVVLAYRDNHDEPHGCYPSLKRLAKDCNLSRRTAVRAIRSLERKNKISIRRSGKHGSNHYQITGVWGGDTMTPGSVTMSPGVVSPCHQGGDTMTPEPEVNRKEEPAKNQKPPCLPIPKPEKQKKATKPFRPGRTLDDFPETPVVSATAPDPPADDPPADAERSNGNLETFWRDLIRVYKREIGRPLRSMGMKTCEKFVEICERYGTEKVEIGFSELLAENREYLRGHTAPKSPAGWIVFRLEDSIASAEVEPKEKNYDNWVDGEKYRGPNGKWWLNGMPLLTAKEE